MTQQLHGKVAVVTGASRGIGAAVARRYSDEGASVVVSHFPSSEMQSLAADVVSELTSAGRSALAVPTDVTDTDQVRDLVRTTTETFGVPDILVANAAAFHRGPWNEASDDDWDRVFAVNARGTFVCCREFFPGMAQKGSGSIIALSSVTARAGVTGMLPYVASKGAVVALTRALAREIGASGVRVNAVAPGAIRTKEEGEASLGTQGDYMAATFQSIPRRGLPKDLTGMFVYLASDDSSFVTGQVFAVDGGWVHR